MSTDVDQYDKSHRLSQDQKEEVQQALRKYKRTSYGFGVLGMGYGAYRAYTRKAPTGRLLISVGIGYFVGSFVGTIIGFAAAANYIKKSPYRDAIMQAMRESNNSPNPYDHVDSVRSSSSSSSANTRYDAGPSDGDWSQSSLPRTREAMEARAHSGNVRTNQYGDIMDD
ncbi:hypothetical protein H4R34_003044 [Dimargaris verticillata]|uniref:Transmembrane protein n=1 Tax=Dimargaris verticillata TaxID=2761393 RepID=A0A9W8B6V2_9FUNG|nr:hypothetical protein H4R34_003044 [Dimargaris verticillata]